MAFMASRPAAELTDSQRAALDALTRDLRTVFGARLHSLVVYGLGAIDDDDELRTLGLVDRVMFDDLTRLMPFASDWHRRRLAVPLLLSAHEFARTLDVFPLEYGSIIASHIVVAGTNPFGGAHVAEADRRRACEQQAKSHLIHLREGFLETDGDPRHVAQLIGRSAPAFRALLTNLSRLAVGDSLEHEVHLQHDPGALAEAINRAVGIPAPLIAEVLSARTDMSTVADPTALLARYLDAVEQIWRYVDGWRA
jgi:hypothetical protein